MCEIISESVRNENQLESDHIPATLQVMEQTRYDFAPVSKQIQNN